MFNKTKFKDLKKNKILIYDQTNEDVLKKTILYDLKYTVLPVRFERYYLSLIIIAYFIKNIIKITLLSFKDLNFRYIHRSVILGYHLSCIEYVKPKVIITSIDNSSFFYRLGGFYKYAVFISIQNGSRGFLCENSIAFGHLEMCNAKFMNFGLFENEIYGKFGYDTKRFFPIGSLKAGYYKSMYSKNEEIEYDICFVSQFRKTIMCENKNRPEFKYSFDRLCQFLVSFININNIKNICIACRSNEEIEYNYFNQIFKGKHNLHIIKKNDIFSTYRCMDRSKIIVSHCATSPFEAFGWGKKVIFCNFTGVADYGVPSLPEMCYIEKDDYQLFEAKLSALMGMDYDVYREANKKHFKYFMNYNPKIPTHKYIRDVIFKYI